jgi:subtilisin family serine protease
VATTHIAWNWGTNSNIDFHANTDILDFGWFQADQFTVSEVNGTVVIAIPSNHQTYTLQQPQYVYNLDQAAGAPAPSSSRSEGQPGDAAQYVLQKLSLADVHRMVRGTNVPIAVIDSEIDAAHPDLEGAVTQRYDAVGAPDKPHPHGTGMAGAIGARQRLLGTAPAARLLAVHAFSTSVATPESTTFNILKGINWAVGQGTRSSI